MDIKNHINLIKNHGYKGKNWNRKISHKWDSYACCKRR